MLRLRELRTEENLTQGQLAEKLGLAWYNIGDWERGKAEPSISDLIKIADYFSCSIDYLVGREDFLGHIVKTTPEKEENVAERYKKLPEHAQAFIEECIKYVESNS